jgi:hypothetical protein
VPDQCARTGKGFTLMFPDVDGMKRNARMYEEKQSSQPPSTRRKRITIP